MKYLLDTNICVYLLNRSIPSVLTRMTQQKPGDVAISSITLGELEFGLAKSARRAENASRLALLMDALECLPFDGLAAMAYGPLRAALDQRGTPIGPLDTLIAAHAVALKLTLVTNNVDEFKRVRGLTLENWAAA